MDVTPAPPCVADPESVGTRVLPCLLDIGETMIIAGADVNRVEHLLRQVGVAYGAAKMNVLVITASIVVTMTMPDGAEITQTRRIEAAPSTDFTKLEKLTRLCEHCIASPLAPKILKEKFEHIRNRPFPLPALYLGGVLSAGSFAIFFGGSVIDGAMAVLFGALVCLLLQVLRPLTPNTIVFNFLASLLSGLGICLVGAIAPDISPAMVIIGVIMLLIPGMAMTNATRDMIAGDTISGALRFVESLLWATALALGYMVAMLVFGISQPGVMSNGTPLVQMITAIPASFGFALFFNVRKQLLGLATLGGVLTQGMYLLAAGTGSFSDVFMPTLIAAGFAAIYSEALSQKLHVPTSIFFIVSVIPLIPGRGLYYTMQSLVQQNWELAGYFALVTLYFALGIAIAIVIVWAFLQTWRNIQDHRARKSAPKENLLEAPAESDEA